MKKMLFACLFVVGVSTVLVGCAVTRQAMENHDACKADPACYAKMMEAKNFTTVAVARAVDTQVPGASSLAQVCGFIAGCAVSFFVGASSNMKKKEGK